MFFKIFGRSKKRIAGLHDAVKEGNLNEVGRILDQGADVNASDEINQETALHIAVDQGNQALVQYLLSRGGNPNTLSKRGVTPFLIALSVGDNALPIIELLLETKADPWLALKAGSNAAHDPFQIATSSGANGILRYLIAFGLVPKPLLNGTSLLHLAAIGGDADTVDILVKAGVPIESAGGDGATPLHYAVLKGNEIVAAALLRHGANVQSRDSQDCTPLYHAALGGSVSILNLLLEHAANPDDLSSHDNSVMSPLLGAVIHGYEEVVKRLLDAGVSPEHQIGDFPPVLDVAMKAGHIGIVKIIRESILKRKTAGLKNADHSEASNTQFTDNSPLSIDEIEQIRKLDLLAFSETFFPNVRFRNAIVDYAVRDQLPFTSIGHYLDAGDAGKLELLRIPRLGMGSLVAFDDAIRASLHGYLPTPVSANESPESPGKRNELVEQIETLYPGVFEPLLDQHRNTLESDFSTAEKLEAVMLEILNDTRLSSVALRRFAGETLSEIGESLGLSRERIRQIEARVKPWMTQPISVMSAVEETQETVDGIRQSWRDLYQRLHVYFDCYGDTDVPHQWPDDPKLGLWVSAQRQKYKKGELLPEKISLLEALNFNWSLRQRGSWDDRFQELVDFKQSNGHFDVPTNYSAAPKLNAFLASVRYKYKQGELGNERLQRLMEINFPFEARCRRSEALDEKKAQEIQFQSTNLPENFSLAGCTVAITGRLEGFTRDEARQLAEEQGAKVSEKLSKKVDLLIYGADAGSKLPSAQQLGIKIIDENQFRDLILKNNDKFSK